MTNSDEAFYLAVAKELSSGSRDEALWMKAFALENGDESRTKAHYIRLRVARLASISEHKQIDSYNYSNGDVPHPSPQRLGKQVVSKKRGTNRVLVVFFGLLIVALGAAATKVVFPKKDVTTLPPSVEKRETKAPEAIPEKTAPLTDLSDLDLLFNYGVLVEKDGTHLTLTLKGEITQKMSKGVQLALGNPQLKTPADLLMVKLDSNGGDLYAAMEIGRAMKAHDTKRNDRAVIVNSDSVCYSSCVFIAAAGLQRLLDGKVGIHRPYAMNPQKSLPESQRWLDKVASDARSYLREMGVVESLYNDMANIPPGELHVFSSQKEMDSYGLLRLHPAFEENMAALLMEKFGIKDRQIFMARNRRAETECASKSNDVGLYNQCIDRILSGG